MEPVKKYSQTDMYVALGVMTFATIVAVVASLCVEWENARTKGFGEGALFERDLQAARYATGGSIEFTDCDGAHHIVAPAVDRFVIIIGDRGCAQLIKSPPSERLSCTVTQTGAKEQP